MQVQGNFIGTNAAGTAALGNGAGGIDINSGATGNTIGGTAAGAANVIAGNGYASGSPLAHRHHQLLPGQRQRQRFRPGHQRQPAVGSVPSYVAGVSRAGPGV